MPFVPVPIKAADNTIKQLSTFDDGSGILSNVFLVFAGSDLVSSGNPFPVTTTVSSIPELPAGNSRIGRVRIQQDSSTVTAENPFSVRGRTSVATATFSRASGTLSYAAYDHVVKAGGGLIELPFVVPHDGGTAYLVGFSLATDKKNITPALRIWIFDDPNVTVANDGDPFLFTFADEPSLVGTLLLPAMTTSADTVNSTSSRTEAAEPSLFVKTKSDSRSLWLAIETQDDFDADSAQEFTIKAYFDVH